MTQARNDEKNMWNIRWYAPFKAIPLQQVLRDDPHVIDEAESGRMIGLSVMAGRTETVDNAKWREKNERNGMFENVNKSNDSINEN